MNLEFGKKEYLLLSCQTKAILFGSLLGNGSLFLRGSSVNAKFEMRHSIVQKDYFMWKRNSLKNELSFNFTDANDISEQLSNSKNITESFYVYVHSTHKLVYHSKVLPSLTFLYNLMKKNGRIGIKRK
jgi:hypothetical protein